MTKLRVFAVRLLGFFLVAGSAVAQHPAGWSAVQALAPGTRVEVRTDTRKSECHVSAVTDSTLSCVEGPFLRAEIKSITRRNKGKSTLAGMALGAGLGAGAGAGIGAAVNSGDTGSLLHVSGGKSAAVGAGLGVIFGAAIGAGVGHAVNLFPDTIYRR